MLNLGDNMDVIEIIKDTISPSKNIKIFFMFFSVSIDKAIFLLGKLEYIG